MWGSFRWKGKWGFSVAHRQRKREESAIFKMSWGGAWLPAVEHSLNPSVFPLRVHGFNDS